MPSYELAGPFHGSNAAFLHEETISHHVSLRAERNPAHPLNPVGHLRRVVSGQHIVQDAILLLGRQYFEIFTVVQERQDSPQGKGKLKSKLRSVANSASTHIPKRLRKGSSTADEDSFVDDFDSFGQFAEEGDGSLKSHLFSCGVAFTQILKIRAQDTSVTVYYHPNTMKAAKLSKNKMTAVMRFTFCLDSEQETVKLLKDLEKRICRYSQASMFLGEQYALPSIIHIIAITRPLCDNSSQQAAELLLAKDAPWGTTISAPEAWGPEATGSSLPIWIFLTTPLGYGKCEISAEVVSLYAKDEEAHFYVGVRHPQVSGATLTTVSQLKRIRTADNSSEEPLPTDADSDDNWQPEEDVDDSDSPQESDSTDSNQAEDHSLASTHSMRGALSGLQRSSASVSASRNRSQSSVRGRGSSTNGHADRHIRVHCRAKLEPASYSFAEDAGTASPRSALTTTFERLLSQSPGLSSPWLLAVLFAAGAVLWLVFSWSLLLTALNLGLVAFWVRTSQRSRLTRSGSDARSSKIWRIQLVKAELVTDEQWSAAGESIIVKVSSKSEESAEERRKRLAEEYGFSAEIVERYMLAFKGDEAMALSKMKATFEWKKEMGTAHIMEQPQPHFQFFKQMFRHALLGTTKGGHPIWFMKVGDMKQGHKIFKDSSLTNRDLARHVSLCMDYMYQIVENAPLPNGRALWILDLKGMGLSDMGSEAFEMGKQIAGMISAHWPERLYRSFIINMPGFFSILWKIVEPMLAASTRKKIRLLRGKSMMLEEMLEEMDIKDIPREYGGELEGEIYSAAKEKEFWSFVKSIDTPPE